MVMDTLGLDAKKVNPKGGAIALGVRQSHFQLSLRCVVRTLTLGFSQFRTAPARRNVSGSSSAAPHHLRQSSVSLTLLLYACSGGRLLSSLLYELKRTEQKVGVATLCMGTGASS